MLVCVIVMVPLKCVEQHFNAGLCNSHGSSKMCRAALQCWFV